MSRPRERPIVIRLSGRRWDDMSRRDRRAVWAAAGAFGGGMLVGAGVTLLRISHRQATEEARPSPARGTRAEARRQLEERARDLDGAASGHPSQLVHLLSTH